MKRTTIVADEGLLLEIKHMAEEQGRSVGDVIQEALREYVKSRRSPKRGKINFAAAAQSGHTDISVRSEDILGLEADRRSGWP